MKQFAVALLVALSLPAFAGSVGFDTGTFQSGKLTGSFARSGHLDISITGTLNTIAIDTGMLMQNMSGCPTGATCFDFTGGSVAVDGTKFTDSISGGIVISSTGVATISAILSKEPGVASGGAVTTFDFSGSTITFGSADVAVNSSSVPEPSALALLGLGFAGLVLPRIRNRANAVHRHPEHQRLALGVPHQNVA